MSEPQATAPISYRPISGFSGYRVGDDGSVWCNKVRGSQGKSVGEWRRLAATPLKGTGYLQIDLCHEGKRKKFSVHRLVLQEFVGQCPDGMECLHGDNDRTNNALSNLRWGTPTENQSDRVRHGTHLSGEGVATSKITSSDACQIRDLYSSGKFTQKQIADRFGISRSNVSIIVRGKGWGHS